MIFILALIAVGGQGGLAPLEFSVTESRHVALESTPEFSLPTPTPEPVPPERPVADFNFANQIELPPMAIPPVAVSSVGDTDSADAAADQPGIPALGVSATAERILTRVSSAGGKRGEVQFALAWKNVNDVDLHVIAPSGEHISHMHRRSKCLGMLDVDMNVHGESSEPVENIRWITHAPAGRYTVLIHLFRIHSPRDERRTQHRSPFELLVQLGSEQHVESAAVAAGDQIAVFRYIYVPESIPAPQRELLRGQIEELHLREEQMAAPLLDQARHSLNQVVRQRLLTELVQRYPHTDAAIEALQMIDGEVHKR
ncbi:MAG: hypothetical protein D6753_14510 [Planctomycetota bacterium]|nr:MAG: hypothetical protein D6753_14510 [Planctomycetota bacterium]